MFQVIDGGIKAATLAPEAVRQKYKQLRRMEMHMTQARNAHSSPRSGRAALAGGVVAVGLFGLTYLAEQAGLLPVPGAPAMLRQVIGLFPVAAGIAAWFYMLRKSAYPASWAELIDQELADYDPVDKDAYRRLQERTKAAGYINFDEVYEYLAVERYAVRVASGQYTPPKQSFTSKKV